MQPEQPTPATDERDRFLLGCSLIQSGFVDQDEDAPGWFDILQWHPCFEEANCRARDNSGPCACSGVPFISDEVWREMGKAVSKIREDAHARGIAEGRSQATEGWEREWAPPSADALQAALDAEEERARAGLTSFAAAGWNPGRVLRLIERDRLELAAHLVPPKYPDDPCECVERLAEFWLGGSFGPWEPADQPEPDPLSCGDCYDIAHDELDERDTCDEHVGQPDGGAR